MFKTNNRRRGVTAAVAAMVAVPLSLTACTGSADSADGQLNLWLSAPPSDEQQEVVEKLYVTDFTDSHPGTDVNVTYVPADGYGEKQQTALAAGQGPDLVGAAGPSFLLPYNDAGYLQDLTDVSEENGWADKIFPWALQAGTTNGKVIALPSAYETLVLFYNKTLFEENGWEPPTDRVSLEALAEEMQRNDIIPFAGGNADYRAVLEITFSALLNQIAGAGYFHDALAGDASWADDGCVDTASTMLDYFDKGWIGGSTEEYFTKGFNAVYGDFATGAAGMYISGSYDFTILPQYFGAEGNTSEWGWVPLPPMAEGLTSNVFPLAVGGTYSVNAQSKNVETAEEYLAWLYDSPGAAWAQVAAGVDGATPLPIAFEPSDVPDNVDPALIDHYTQINKASEEDMVGYVTYTSLGPASEAYVVGNIEKVITHDITPADFCGALQDASQQDLDGGLVPAVWATAAR